MGTGILAGFNTGGGVGVVVAVGARGGESGLSAGLLTPFFRRTTTRN